MIIISPWGNVVKNNGKLNSPKHPKRYIIFFYRKYMGCFCGCETYQKNENGYRVACVKCGHGPQNHDDEFRSAARKNESLSQKRDADFG